MREFPKPEYPPTLGLERLESYASQNKNYREVIERQNFFFHIVGTNGKGSLASGIAQNLRKFKIKVGLFTSPHLVNQNERIRINGVPISDYLLVDYLNLNPEFSYFEAMFVSAMIYFKDCDYVVLEAGLGGRFDATNVITNPLFVGVTSLSMDHEQYLGNSIEKIATEKIQVIKNSCKVAAYSKDKKILDPLFKNISYVDQLNTLIQFALITAGFDIPLEKIQVPVWSGRFHFLNNILVDGCHNVDGVEYFKKQLHDSQIKLESIAFCGLIDKKPEILLKSLSELGLTIHVIPELNPRSMSRENAMFFLNQMPEYCRGEVLNLEKFIRICDANREKNFAFVGSLYGLGALYHALKISPWCP